MKLLSVGFLLCVAGALSYLTPISAFAQNTQNTSQEVPAVKSPPKAADGAPVELPISPTKMEIAFGAYQRGYYLTAFNDALPLAEKGDADAQTLIAYLYEQGLGVSRNDETAASWYKLAADGGNREAQYAYGLVLLQGKSVKQDFSLARGYLKKAADAGHNSAKFNYAQLIASEKSTHSGYKEALPYYLDAAKAGIADAQYIMAQLYIEGLGVDQIDLTKARSWLRRAAASGLPVAQLELGIWLVNGKGGKAEPEVGFRWILEAAIKGNVIAQNRLARLYFTGVGTKKDPIEGAIWYLIASKNGKKDLQLDDFYSILSDEQKKQATSAAQKLMNPN